MNLHVRSITAAALLAFAGVIAVGALVFLRAAVERPLVAGGLPWMAPPQVLSAGAVPLVENTAEQRPVEPQQTAAPEQPGLEPQQTAAQEQRFIETGQIAARAVELRTPADVAWPELLRGEATVPEQATLIPPRPAEEPPAAEAQPPATETAPTEPAIATGARTPERNAAPKAQSRLSGRKPVGEAPAHATAAKAATRRVQTAKKSTNEALNTVRKFGDRLRDIPVSSYSADGTRREIVIHPRSMQDVYYYSAPR